MKINNYYNDKMSDILSLPSDNIIYTNNVGISANSRQWIVNDLIKANNVYIRDKQAKLNKWSNFYFALYQNIVAENNAKQKRKTIKKSTTVKAVA